MNQITNSTNTQVFKILELPSETINSIISKLGMHQLAQLASTSLTMREFVYHAPVYRKLCRKSGLSIVDNPRDTFFKVIESTRPTISAIMEYARFWICGKKIKPSLQNTIQCYQYIIYSDYATEQEKLSALVQNCLLTFANPKYNLNQIFNVVSIVKESPETQAADRAYAAYMMGWMGVQYPDLMTDHAVEEVLTEACQSPHLPVHLRQYCDYLLGRMYLDRRTATLQANEVIKIFHEGQKSSNPAVAEKCRFFKMFITAIEINSSFDSEDRNFIISLMDKKGYSKYPKLLLSILAVHQSAVIDDQTAAIFLKEVCERDDYFYTQGSLYLALLKLQNRVDCMEEAEAIQFLENYKDSSQFTNNQRLAINLQRAHLRLEDRIDTLSLYQANWILKHRMNPPD